MTNFGEALRKMMDSHSRYLSGELRNAPELNAEQVRSRFRAEYAQAKVIQSGHLHTFRTTYSSNRAYVCTQPLSKLQRVGIADLVLFELAKGKYMVLRNLEHPDFTVGARMLVEDHLGRVVFLLLYNYIDYGSKLPVEEALPMGSIFIVKQPYLKVSQSGDVSIRVDSPSDFVRVDRSHSMYEKVSKIKWRNRIEPEYLAKSLPKNPTDCKNEGNALFKQGKYEDALEAYLVALKASSDPTLTFALWLNISAACLNLSRFEEAIIYAKLALATKGNVKAYFRAGKAHYGLWQFKEAHDMFEDLLNLDPSNQTALLEKQLCEERLKEQEGYIDVGKLHFKSLESPCTPINFGQFVGPIKIAATKRKGRGIVATSDIQSGTLLLASKAFQVATETDLIDSVAAIHIARGTVEPGNNVKLLADACQMVLKNPNTFGKQVYSLWTNDPEFDKNFKVFCDEGNKTEPIADAERMRKILQQNCLTVYVRDAETEKLKAVGGGLFILASYFNHSCLSNARWKNFNDVIVVRSNRFIRAGDEVTITYQNGVEELASREADNAKRGFTCGCALCKLDRSESSFLHQQRRQLIKKLEGLYLKYPISKRMNRKFRREVATLTNEMVESYRNRSSLKLGLCNFYIQLAASMKTEQSEEYVSRFTEMIDKALQCLGFTSEMLIKWATDGCYPLPTETILCPDSIEKAVHLMIRQFSVVENTSLYEKWLKVLVKTHRILYGSTTEMLEDKFKDFPFATEIRKYF